MKKVLMLLSSLALMMSGSAGLVWSSFAEGGIMLAIAPIVDTSYSQADYDLAYEKSKYFKYRNAAVKGLSDALDTQLPGWKEWKYIPYAVQQLEGNVYEVKMYAWDTADQAHQMYEVKDDSSMTGGDIFNTLVKIAGQSAFPLEDCRSITAMNNYSYDAFSRLTQCEKEKNNDVYTVVSGVVTDAEKVMDYGMNVARLNLGKLYPQANISSLSGDELVNSAESSSYYASYGDFNIIGGLANSWAKIAWRNQKNRDNIFASDFIENTGTMTNDAPYYDRYNFATVYARAKAINPDFSFNFDNYIEQPDSGDNNSGNNNPGDNSNTGDNNNSGDNSNTDNNASSTGSEKPDPTDKTPQSSISDSPSGSKAPNTGAQKASGNSANVSSTLSTIALLAGIIGAALLAKGYLFSPLKRRR